MLANRPHAETVSMKNVFYGNGGVFFLALLSHRHILMGNYDMSLDGFLLKYPRNPANGRIIVERLSIFEK